MKTKLILTSAIILLSSLAILRAQPNKEKVPDLDNGTLTTNPKGNEFSDQVFKTEHIWNAKVTIADVIILGESKHGLRRIVPITGGSFEGPNIKGEVLSGGEDWQLTRPDGDTELYARYLLKTNDGYIIQVINSVLIHNPSYGENGEPYLRSVIDLEAPNNSPYEYLNHTIFLGTLTQPKLKQGEKPYVVIGVYKVL
jgi:hypothetical protein